jgi:hypothetical protein
VNSPVGAAEAALVGALECNEGWRPGACLDTYSVSSPGQQGGASRVPAFREMRWASRRAPELAREGENKGEKVVKKGKIRDKERW